MFLLANKYRWYKKNNYIKIELDINKQQWKNGINQKGTSK